MSALNKTDQVGQPTNRTLNLTQIESSNQTPLPLNETKENKQFLSCLPKINPEYYQGKDLCSACLKPIAKNHQAISCDKCDRWTHRTCANMDVNKYRELKKMVRFSFLCKNCSNQMDFKGKLKQVIREKDLPELAEKVNCYNSGVIILHINCRSLINKETELLAIILETNADIICLTETWYDESVPEGFNVPEGYSIIRKDRSPEFLAKYNKKKGGGVAILHKSHLKIQTKNDLMEENEEDLWVHVKTENSFLLGAIYRPEYSKFLEEDVFEDKLQEITAKFKNTIIAGDFNIDLLKPGCPKTRNFKGTLISNGFKQHIKKPTRINHTNLKPSLLDHFWSKNESIKIEKSGTFYGISDHFGTYVKLNIKNPKAPPKIIKFRSYRNFNSENFNTDSKIAIEKSDINSHILNENVNEATESLVKIISDIADKNAPFVSKKITKNRTPPWFTKELKEKIKNKNLL